VTNLIFHVAGNCENNSCEGGKHCNDGADGTDFPVAENRCGDNDMTGKEFSSRVALIPLVVSYIKMNKFVKTSCATQDNNYPSTSIS